MERVAAWRTLDQLLILFYSSPSYSSSLKWITLHSKEVFREAKALKQIKMNWRHRKPRCSQNKQFQPFDVVINVLSCDVPFSPRKDLLLNMHVSPHWATGSRRARGAGPTVNRQFVIRGSTHLLQTSLIQKGEDGNWVLLRSVRVTALRIKVTSLSGGSGKQQGRRFRPTTGPAVGGQSSA